MRGVAASVFGVLLVVAAWANTPPPALAQGRAWMLGTWSLDGSCASGFGMALKREGKVSYDEYGEGLWALANAGNRLVLIIEDISQEADRKTEAELIEFQITARRGNTMTLLRLSDRATLEAVKCRGQ
jgi:hypothetical protein